MRKRILWFLTTVILCGTTVVALSSCSDNDDKPAAQTPLGDKIVGKWYAETPKQVTLGTGKNAVECAKVVLVGSFDEGGEGFWALILVDKQNRAIQPVGKDGEEHPYWADCNYSVTGNNVNVELIANYLPTSQMEWTFNYNGTCLQTKYEDRIIDLHPITTGEDAMYQEWMQQLGFGADADNYNINDKDITAKNWRQLEAIYIYDGVGADVKDEKGRTGYTTVHMPWYKGGVVDSNLDPAFCDDILPENGWEWVLNLCGDRSMVNNNFFAVYNKYSGVLRFFYYMPNQVTSGEDHLWEIDMTNMMAQRSVWGYGLPLDLTIADKTQLGQEKENFYVDYVTPYVRQQAQDGKISPNQGWWAFDVDLSLYRPDDKSFADDQSISLQIRSWDENHVSLTSAITGKLEGDMKLDQTKTYTIVSKKKGVFGFIKDAVNIGKSVVSTIASAKSGDVKGAFTNGISAAKDGYSLYGAIKNNKNSSTTVTDTLSRITGTFNASLQADAETDGIISTSKPVMGAASPTIPGKSFITAGTGLGDGVWNIKNTPMVYSIFSQNIVDYWPDSPKHYAADWTFFDPSSIEVVLNPNVFPEDQIEWMQVDAVAIARKKMHWKGTDPFRKAMGLKPMEDCYYESFDEGRNGAVAQDYGKDVDNYVFNFVGAGDFAGQTIEGTNFPKSYDQFEYYSAWFDTYPQFPRVFGCGTNDYIIEPQITCVEEDRDLGVENFFLQYAFVFPAIEINVSVLVKLTSQEEPILLSRNYLPNYKDLQILHSEEYVLNVIDRILAKKNLSPKTKGHTQSYDFLAARINKCFKLISGYSR